MEWKHDYQSYIAGKSQVFLLNYGWNYVELWRGGKGQIISSNYALHRILEMFTTIIWTRGRGKGVGDQGGRGEGGNRAPIFHREREGASTPNSKFDNFIQDQKEFTKPNFNLHPPLSLSSTTCIWYLAITRLACNGTKQYRTCRNALIISDLS